MASLDDNEIMAGLLLMTHWKHEHQKTMWKDLTDKMIAKTQLRFASITTFILLLFKIGLVVFQAYSPVGVNMFSASSPIACFMVLFIWAASLSEKHPWQNKVACLVLWPSDMWYSEITNIIHHGYSFHFMDIVGLLVIPGSMYVGFRYTANAVRFGHTRKEMIQISTSLVAKVLGSMPLFFYLILGLISKLFAHSKAHNYVCDLTSNAYLEHDVSIPGKIYLQSVWRNCSRDYQFLEKFNETLDPSSFTLKDDQMKRALIKLTSLEAAQVAQLFQAIEITYLFLTSVILVRVRKKSIKDIFKLKITFSGRFNLFRDPNTTAIKYVLTFHSLIQSSSISSSSLSSLNNT